MDTYTLRVIWEGEILAEQTGLDYETGFAEFDKTESLYLNLPDSEAARGTAVQLFRESDDWIEAETAF